MTPQDSAKRAAAALAIDRFVEPGMRLGLGSGSTAHWMVRLLGERVRAGLDVVGVATSTATADLARESGIRVVELDAVERLDVTLDGADEIDPQLRMIKGGGACLLWEKIVAAASARMVAMVDTTKTVTALGAFPLPIEVVRFGWRSTQRHVAAVLAASDVDRRAIRRREVMGDPLLTDSGHYILDLDLGRIGEPEVLAEGLRRLPGVVETGLFLGIASAMVIGREDGTARLIGSPE
jgi:ribose 5-phosphate isomerase A